MTYFPFFRKLQVLKRLIQFMPLVRKVSLQANTRIMKPTYKHGNKGSCWISPHLTPQRIQEIKSVTGITTGLNYISWVKMSVPKLHLLDWNLKVLPESNLNQMDESSILALAYDVKYTLPKSDLYVMESFPSKESKHHVSINKIRLSSMLTVLLNGLHRDLDWEEKVIFQKKFVMNYLYNLQIGSERISTRSVVENILLKPTYLSDCDLTETSFSMYPTISVDCEHVKNFKQSELEKQENLSLALLLTLSFIDVNLLKNEKSLEKIQNRRKCNGKSES